MASPYVNSKGLKHFLYLEPKELCIVFTMIAKFVNFAHVSGHNMTGFQLKITLDIKGGNPYNIYTFKEYVANFSCDIYLREKNST